ncbi:hypothetical protein IGS74_13645 [Aureimonas sp. OT7]|nr:hypothetical protein IGS74_13645 [Aureimonas sp. OT7]
MPIWPKVFRQAPEDGWRSAVHQLVGFFEQRRRKVEQPAPPKVTSSVVQITPRAEPLPVDLPKLEKITALAFGQRRKMLRQSLKAAGGEKLLDRAGIDARRRAETLSVAEFVTLANLAEGLSTGS